MWGGLSLKRGIRGTGKDEYKLTNDTHHCSIPINQWKLRLQIHWLLAGQACFSSLSDSTTPHYWPCQGSGRQSPASHRGVPDSSLGQSMWDLWWTKWHWDTFLSEFFGSFCQYHSTIFLHTHVSSRGWTICPLVAAVQRCSLTSSKNLQSTPQYLDNVDLQMLCLGLQRISCNCVQCPRNGGVISVEYICKGTSFYNLSLLP
jgi:hypothetical protein